MKYGLRELAQSTRPGIAALKRVAGVGRLSSAAVGFRLGPRLNAGGRLDDAMRSLELLTTDDPALAERLAIGLDEENKARQGIEREMLDEAIALVEAQGGVGEPAQPGAGVAGLPPRRRRHRRLAVGRALLPTDAVDRRRGGGQSGAARDAASPEWTCTAAWRAARTCSSASAAIAWRPDSPYGSIGSPSWRRVLTRRWPRCTVADDFVPRLRRRCRAGPARGRRRLPRGPGPARAVRDRQPGAAVPGP